MLWDEQTIAVFCCSGSYVLRCLKKKSEIKLLATVPVFYLNQNPNTSMDLFIFHFFSSHFNQHFDGVFRFVLYLGTSQHVLCEGCGMEETACNSARLAPSYGLQNLKHVTAQYRRVHLVKYMHVFGQKAWTKCSQRHK